MVVDTPQMETQKITFLLKLINKKSHSTKSKVA